MKAQLTTWVLVSAMQAGAANAQSVDTTAHLRRGIELRREGHDQEARAEFQAAYDATRSPIAAGQLGFAQQALGDWVAALGHVREALASPDDDWVRRNHALLEGSLAVIQQHVGELEVVGAPVGAEVRVNGEPVGVLPMAAPAEVPAGTVRIEVWAAGHVRVVRDVEVAPRSLARETVDLPPVVRHELLPRLGTREPLRDDRATRASLRTVAWLTGIGAVASLAAGTATYALYLSAVNAFNVPGSGCVPPDTTPSADQSSTCRSDLALGTWTLPTEITTYVVGTGLAVTSVVLFVRSNVRPATTAARWGITACVPRPSGLMCGGRF